MLYPARTDAHPHTSRRKPAFGCGDTGTRDTPFIMLHLTPLGELHTTGPRTRPYIVLVLCEL